MTASLRGEQLNVKNVAAVLRAGVPLNHFRNGGWNSWGGGGPRLRPRARTQKLRGGWARD